MKNSPSRRTFLKTSSGAAAAMTLPELGSTDRRRDELRVGLVGCGGRGSGAAVQALKADPNTRLVAMADAFQDRIDSSHRNLTASEVGARVDVPRGRMFTGLDCHEKLLATDLDVVLLASPPYFRPMQIEAAVKAGVHIFAEKPVSVDGPGTRRVMAASEAAEKKGLCVVSGLCYRYHDGRRATMAEIHKGRIGEILGLHVNYITSALWHRGNDPKWSEMEYQCRNWLYYTWLSGDHIAEQHIHSLDVMAWAMKDVYPAAAVSLGGRQVRTEAKYGNVYDHFATTYEWENGVKGHSYCRQQAGCHRDVNDHFIGTKGKCSFFKHSIKDHDGGNAWRFRGKRTNMYQNEHDELFAAIRAGKVINNGPYMCKSTLMAHMGRLAAYTGQRVTWEQAWNSNDVLGPDNLVFGDNEYRPVAMPGKTKLI